MNQNAWVIYDNKRLIYTYINKKRILTNETFVTEAEVNSLVRQYIKEHRCSLGEACEILKRHYRKEYHMTREQYEK